jgi:hypothetical protein
MSRVSKNKTELRELCSATLYYPLRYVIISQGVFARSRLNRMAWESRVTRYKYGLSSALDDLPMALNNVLERWNRMRSAAIECFVTTEARSNFNRPKSTNCPRPTFTWKSTCK